MSMINSILNFSDNIPGKIFPKLQPVMTQDWYLHFPYKIYRELFHIAGSFCIIWISYLLYKYVNKKSPILVFITMILRMSFQEFYLHPHKYNQWLRISILDLLSRIVPYTIFLIYLYRYDTEYNKFLSLKIFKWAF